MVQLLFSVISGILCVIAYIPYLLNILSGKTKPERTSWFLWTVLGIISLASQIDLGATFSLVLAFVLTLGSLVIFLLSLRYGSSGMFRRDFIALFFCLAGLVIWLYSGEPLVALTFNIIIGSMGALLTIIKVRKQPGTETTVTWLLASISGVFSLASIGKLDVALIAYPTYIIVTNFAVFVASIKPRDMSDLL